MVTRIRMHEFLNLQPIKTLQHSILITGATSLTDKRRGRQIKDERAASGGQSTFWKL
jgi:hypothetical protein